MSFDVRGCGYSATCDNVGAGQMTEFKQSEKLFIWRIKKLEGGSELMCRIKVCEVVQITCNQNICNYRNA